MLTNYLTIAWRTLRKRVGPTTINIAGLAVGLAACLLIGLWVQHEGSYDDFHPNADRTYRVTLDYRYQQTESHRATTAMPLGPALARDVPAVETATRFRHAASVTFRHGDQAFTNNQVAVADSQFFDVFGGFTLIHGSRATALDGRGVIVVTASLARTVFGRTDVVGETLQAGGSSWTITGVMADVPEASHIPLDAVIDFRSVPAAFEGNWMAFDFYTYATLTPGTSRAQFERMLQTIADRHVHAMLREQTNLSPDEYRFDFVAQPLPSIHLHSDLEEEIQANGSITTVYAFSAIGLFILLIACINFMNLATARASERATEVGMRKALGAGRSQLAGQFLGEAILTTSLASVVALVLASVAMPAFNQWAGLSLDLRDLLLQPEIVLTAGAVVLAVGCVAGSYPAIVLSRFAPAAVLKASGRHTSGGQGRRLRQGLVVVQFALSVVLIVGTLVAWKQFNFIQTKRLGLATERVVTIEQANTLGDRQATLIERLQQLPMVTAASAGDALFDYVPGQSYTPDQAPEGHDRSLNQLQVRPGFVEAMGIDLVAGRTFDPARPADSSAVIINRAAAEAFGWDRPDGHTLSPDTSSTYAVIGIVDNFHYQSMRQRVQPLVLVAKHPQVPGRPPENVYARLAPSASPNALQHLRATWQAVAGSAPFQYRFLDQSYDQLHRDVQRTGRLFTLFAGLAVLIACLGLFGLATYTVQRRAKEIGIRKALGATAPQVVGLLSKEFLQLVAVAAVIALPIAYVAMQRWLQEFAYRTSVGAGVLAGAAGLAAAVALGAIAYQALQAARLDPATTLHDE